MIPALTRQTCLWTCLGVMSALVFSASAAANPGWIVRVWQIEDGLPQNRVNDVVQGPDGYVWVATAVGLAKFDGIHFTKFNYRKEEEGSDQSVRRIIPGRDHGLWIVPVQGQVLHMNAECSQWSSPQTGLPGSPTSLVVAEDAEGSVWLARSSSKTIVRIKDGRATEFGAAEGAPTNGPVLSLLSDASGTIWLAKGHAVGFFQAGRFVSAGNFYYNARLATAGTNGVWIAAGTQLFQCDRQGRLQDFGSLPDTNPHTAAMVLLEDHAGAVWIGTDTSGLFRYHDSAFEPVETSDPNILSLAEDREHNVWAGTGGGGLDRISPRRVQLEGLDNGASVAAIQSICEDTSGTLWGATPSGLLVCRRNGTWSTPFTNNLEPVLSVAADRQGAVWIGGRNKALYCWRDNRLTRWGTPDEISGINLGLLFASSAGDLWIGEVSPDSVQCLHNGVLRELQLPKRIGGVRAIAEDSSGNIWVGTSTGNLLRADGDHLVDETPRTGVSDRPIWSFWTTPDNALWIGYGGWGLGRLKDGHFTHLGIGQGLPENYISQIVADDQGWTWFGTADQGIFKIRREQLDEAMKNPALSVGPVFYGRNEGLSSMEVLGYSPGAIRSHDGRLWFPLRKSLAVVDPKIWRTEDKAPPVLLSQVTADGRVVASRGGLVDDGGAANLCALPAPLQLPPAHHHLEFDFTAIHFNAPENIRFRYQLVGFDNDWIDAGPERTASYSRLVGGHYEFRLEASLNGGPWSETPTTLDLAVQPFVWQRWWFRLGAVLLFTAGVFAVTRYISFRHLQAQMRLMSERAALDKERTRIARDLHDDLGCSLNKVALTLEMTQRDLEAAKPMNGEIEHCSHMVRQVVKSVDEIVWAINPRNDTLGYMVDYISQFAVEFLHAAGIRCRLDMPDHVPNCVVSPEARHNLFLVVKEALNNIARHARASEVRLGISANDSQVAIVIADNGCGFATVPDNASSDGLRNMRQRMDEIGGQFQLESRPGAGTTVSFHYAWPVKQST